MFFVITEPGQLDSKRQKLLKEVAEKYDKDQAELLNQIPFLWRLIDGVRSILLGANQENDLKQNSIGGCLKTYDELKGKASFEEIVKIQLQKEIDNNPNFLNELKKLSDHPLSKNVIQQCLTTPLEELINFETRKVKLDKASKDIAQNLPEQSQTRIGDAIQNPDLRSEVENIKDQIAQLKYAHEAQQEAMEAKLTGASEEVSEDVL
ncbi:hypothetical protein [Candidatus Phycorickettsia trachydisci]|nr:hypothetical protein [Candidatus Phycorickettsia trachydisci]